MNDETMAAQERITAAGYPCPDCAQPMVGARIWIASAQEMILGPVCRACDQAYRIVWLP